MAATPVAHAETLLAQGRTADALATVTAAGERGDVDALMRHATWLLAGVAGPRDFAGARSRIRRAVEIGHVDGALMEIALVANGCGGPADWAEARRLLDIAAVGDPVAAAQRALLARMAIDDSGKPLSVPEGERLSDMHDVRLFPGLLTPDECRHVAEVAAPMLAPSTVVDPVTGRQSANPIRTSHGAVIGPTQEDLVIQALQHRLAAISGTERDQGEPFSVLHYAPGQEYRPHVDTLPRTDNQRVMTLITYLNQGYPGGDTIFPALDLGVAGRAGDVLLFANVTADGNPDPASRHAGLPVRAGTKWIATRWIRARRYDPWNYAEGA